MTERPSIELALEEALRGGRRDPARRETFYASSFGMCPRKQVAERAGLVPTNPPDARSLFKMMMGTAIHQQAQLLLLQQGYLDPAWTQVVDGKIVERKWTYRCYVGKPDGRALQSGKLVEIKTCDDDAIIRYPDPPDHYKYQCFINARATDISEIELFQLGKNQGLSRTRDLYLDSEWRGKVDQEIDQMEEAWTAYEKTGELPPHDHRFSWENRLCSYNTTPTSQSAGVNGKDTR